VRIVTTLLLTDCTNFVQNAFSGTRVRDFSKKISTIEVQITRFYLLHQIQASGVCCRSTQDQIFFAMTYKVKILSLECVQGLSWRNKIHKLHGIDEDYVYIYILHIHVCEPSHGGFNP